MIRHVVLVKVAPGVAEAEITAIFDGLAALTATLRGARGFAGGRSDSPERMERGYTHGFVVDFDSRADLTAYADHPAHRDLGARIVAIAAGGLDGIIVLDLDIAD